MTDSSPLVVLMTYPAKPEEARELIQALLEARLAACINLVPGLTSHYWWSEDADTEPMIQQDDELLLIVKTTNEKLPALKQLVQEKHPYDVPEILALPVSDAHQPYAHWLKNMLASASA